MNKELFGETDSEGNSYSECMGQNQVSYIERCPYVLVWGRTKCPL